MATPTQDVGRGERLVTIRNAALAWAERWGVELEVLRRLLPAAARFWAGDPFESESAVRESWGKLSDKALRFMAAQLAAAVRDDREIVDAQARIIFWSQEGEVELSAAELAPLDDGASWAEETAVNLAAHAAELRRRRAAASSSNASPPSPALAGPDLEPRRRPGPRCGSCGAEIRWITASNGKRHPLNAERLYVIPATDGAVTLVTDDGTTVRGRASGPGHAAVGGHISHFATCPAAAQHRRRDGARR